MRELVNWKDHVVEYPHRFTKTEAGGYVTLEKAPGTVRQQGTPQNATNFKTMDLAAFEAMLMASENSRKLRQVEDSLGGSVGVLVQKTLTNTMEYPHNSSKDSVQIPASRNTKDYTVQCEAVSVEGGAVGDFEISEKLLNGFKIAFTGSAKKVVVNCYIRGGI